MRSRGWWVAGVVVSLAALAADPKGPFRAPTGSPGTRVR